MNYRMVIEYDGTRYKGWQTLGDTAMTIQGKLQDVLSKMAGEQVELIGSGRTDAGVHARGQVANFHLSERKSTAEIFAYVSRYLPEDIAVLTVEEVPERFHSRYQAVKKTYLYRIHTGEAGDVFSRKYVYDYRKPLDRRRMEQAAQYLIGTHDFMAFCGNRKMKKSTVRTIYEIRFEERPGELDIYYTGNGFLQNMVRILTGTLIEVGDGRREAEEMPGLLESRNRELAGYTAPAAGLTLLNVEYEEDR